MAELFLIELPELRDKGLGKKAMVALSRWAVLLHKVGGLAYGDVRKLEMRTIIARVSPNHIPAIKLLEASGFKSSFEEDAFKDEYEEPRPDHVKLVQETLIIEGVFHKVIIMTTPRHPDPKVIFLNQITESKP